ncbi:MAG TPA: hypothetical protein VN039_12825 [Nitrospira sp.]|nr:hypothetical protein [Nitrospira sp.]
MKLNDLPTVPWDPSIDNSDLIAAVRDEASNEYQRRIPDAIKGDTEATLRALNNYQPNWNEFTSVLLNLVAMQVIRSNSWQNPFAMFKKGMVTNGDTVEEIQTGLVRGYLYDPRREYGEKALFGKHLPEVQTSFHKKNRESMYPISVQRPTLQRAFLTDGGLGDFISNIIDSLNTSDNLDEFLLMTQTLRLYADMDGFFKVHIADIASPSSTSDDARSVLRTLREYADTLPFISRHYNAAKMPVVAAPEDLYLICTPQFKSSLDVNGLAQLFNVSYGDVNYKTVVIPRQYMPDTIEGILTTKDFFQVYDLYFDTAVQPNVAGRYENYFLQHDQIISASRFVPAIAFTTGEGDVIDVTETPVTGVTAITITDITGATVTEVQRGGFYLVNASAITTGDNTGVDLEQAQPHSNFTTLAQSGTFMVSLDEKAFDLTITATATDGRNFSSTLTVPVVGERVDFWPNPSVMPDTDDDGLLEVTPTAPAWDVATNTITIPDAQEGVGYKNGATVLTPGETIVVADGTPVTITAYLPDATHYEFAAGAVTSWTFTFGVA